MGRRPSPRATARKGLTPSAQSSPPKEGRNPGRTAACQPKSEQMPKEETQARNNRRRGCDHRPRRHNGATETPQEPNTQEQQEGPQTCDQTTPPQEQVKDNRHMKRRTNHEGQPRLQTSQRTGAVDTAGQKCTPLRQGKASREPHSPHRSREPQEETTEQQTKP